MTGEQIFVTAIMLVVLLVVIRFIVFLIWYNQQEKKKDKIIRNINENNLKIIEHFCKK